MGHSPSLNSRNSVSVGVDVFTVEVNVLTVIDGILYQRRWWQDGVGGVDYGVVIGVIV
jgi:hypothetical protein